MKPPTATMTTTNHETPRPSDKIQKIWGKFVRQTAKTMWQCNYSWPCQHLLIEGWKTQCTVINQAIKDIATNRSVSKHDAKLHEMVLKWCCEKPGIFPDHIHTMFTAGRSHLEACWVCVRDRWRYMVWCIYNTAGIYLRNPDTATSTATSTHPLSDAHLQVSLEEQRKEPSRWPNLQTAPDRILQQGGPPPFETQPLSDSDMAVIHPPFWTLAVHSMQETSAQTCWRTGSGP